MSSTISSTDALGPASSKLTAAQLVTLALALVVVGYLAILLGGVGKPGSWLLDDMGQITFTDFTALYGGGRLVLEGKATLAYDWAAHAEAMSRAIGRTAQQFPYPYPPTFFSIVAPLAALPYIPALVAWLTLTGALYFAACAAIVSRWQGAIWLGAMIVTLANAVAGQNGFLTAALIGFGLLLVPTRPILAGILLGLLAYKPHLGLLLPLALAAAGQWRTFAAAAATVVATAIVSVACLGIEPWWAFLDNIGRFGTEIATERFSVTTKLQSAYGFAASAGLPKPIAMGLQVSLAGILFGLTFVVWRSTAAHSLKAAWLVTASVLMSPYVYVYDLTLLAIGQAFLLRHWLSTALDKREAIVLLTVNTLVVLMMTVKLPTGFLASLFLASAVLFELRAVLHFARTSLPAEPAPNKI